MSLGSPEVSVGQKVSHPDFGEGVIVGHDPSGFVRVFFQGVGERQVPADALGQATGWIDRVLAGLRPATPETLQRLWMAIEAEELPLMESAATLTAAKIDLLPHQVVLVHKVASARPRRFLVADEVGLGKTIETALVLRELASRGELERAMMVVPAGLVENWRRELNDVFNLDFEVFGSEGDVTDRKSNAFAKHNRLIASVDTLKRPRRMKRILDAPPWDLIVFDEGHHLSAYKKGNKVDKTRNYKLAEALRDHSRDLLLLSATPHQGDHYRFWALVRLLHPALFQDEKDMVENRHRLNAVVFRRTKADACAQDGGPLFARRMVQTEGFFLGDEEKAFYSALLDYLREGYQLSEEQGNALGFIMTIFQKIAASSFAAVRITLLRRLLMLTIHEAIERDEALDVDARDRLYEEARGIVLVLHGLPDDAMGRATAEQIIADAKVKLLKKRQEKIAQEVAASGASDTEAGSAAGEESVTTMVSVGLPEERERIRGLLAQFPAAQETKIGVLLSALGQVWDLNPEEKVVIFATYIGSVDAIKGSIDAAYPGKGVDVLKGGDHGAKTAAQRRFKRPDGPRVLVCTAAGREGINLQFARVLFNFDLPWNPMDLEQRIGRIHRYGQKDTAQVYNLVAADTIEGQIYLLLEEKLENIAKTLGKVDDEGQVAEDFRGQILGQLGSRLSYDKLYQEALLDPTLKRTEQEIEVAMTNAKMARDVVFELFQDLDQFDLGDYKAFDDQGAGMQRLLGFTRRAAAMEGGKVHDTEDPEVFVLSVPNHADRKVSIDRDKAIDSDVLDLLGLEYPPVQRWLISWSGMKPGERALIAKSSNHHGGLLTIWGVGINSPGGQSSKRVVRIGLNNDGERNVTLERGADLLALDGGGNLHMKPQEIRPRVEEQARQALHRHLEHSGVLADGASYSARLLGLVVVE